jgi:hypothetical protein
MQTLNELKVYEVNEFTYKRNIAFWVNKHQVRYPDVCIARRTLMWKIGKELVKHEQGKFYEQLPIPEAKLIDSEQSEYFAKDGSSRAIVTLDKEGNKLVIELRINSSSLLLVFRHNW